MRPGPAATLVAVTGAAREGGSDAARADLVPVLDPVLLAVARYPAGWWPPTADGPFLAAVAEPGETTVVLPEDMLTTLPAPESVERGWQRITFTGPLPWELIGFLADVAARLAAGPDPVHLGLRLHHRPRAGPRRAGRGRARGAPRRSGPRPRGPT